MGHARMPRTIFYIISLLLSLTNAADVADKHIKRAKATKAEFRSGEPGPKPAEEEFLAGYQDKTNRQCLPLILPLSERYPPAPNARFCPAQVAGSYDNVFPGTEGIRVPKVQITVEGMDEDYPCVVNRTVLASPAQRYDNAKGKDDRCFTLRKSYTLPQSCIWRRSTLTLSREIGPRPGDRVQVEIKPGPRSLAEDANSYAKQGCYSFEEYSNFILKRISATAVDACGTRFTVTPTADAALDTNGRCDVIVRVIANAADCRGNTNSRTELYPFRQVDPGYKFSSLPDSIVLQCNRLPDESWIGNNQLTLPQGVRCVVEGSGNAPGKPYPKPKPGPGGPDGLPGQYKTAESDIQGRALFSGSVPFPVVTVSTCPIFGVSQTVQPAIRLTDQTVTLTWRASVPGRDCPEVSRSSTITVVVPYCPGRRDAVTLDYWKQAGCNSYYDEKGSLPEWFAEADSYVQGQVLAACGAATACQCVLGGSTDPSYKQQRFNDRTSGNPSTTEIQFKSAADNAADGVYRNNGYDDNFGYGNDGYFYGNNNNVGANPAPVPPNNGYYYGNNNNNNVGGLPAPMPSPSQYGKDNYNVFVNGNLNVGATSAPVPSPTNNNGYNNGNTKVGAQPDPVPGMFGYGYGNTNVGATPAPVPSPSPSPNVRPNKNGDNKVNVGVNVNVLEDVQVGSITIPGLDGYNNMYNYDPKPYYASPSPDYKPPYAPYSNNPYSYNKNNNNNGYSSGSDFPSNGDPAYPASSSYSGYTPSGKTYGPGGSAGWDSNGNAASVYNNLPYSQSRPQPYALVDVYGREVPPGGAAPYGRPYAGPGSMTGSMTGGGGGNERPYSYDRLSQEMMMSNRDGRAYGEEAAAIPSDDSSVVTSEGAVNGTEVFVPLPESGNATIRSTADDMVFRAANITGNATAGNATLQARASQYKSDYYNDRQVAGAGGDPAGSRYYTDDKGNTRKLDVLVNVNLLDGVTVVGAAPGPSSPSYGPYGGDGGTSAPGGPDNQGKRYVAARPACKAAARQISALALDVARSDAGVSPDFYLGYWYRLPDSCTKNFNFGPAPYNPRTVLNRIIQEFVAANNGEQACYTVGSCVAALLADVESGAICQTGYATGDIDSRPDNMMYTAGGPQKPGYDLPVYVGGLPGGGPDTKPHPGPKDLPQPVGPDGKEYPGSGDSNGGGSIIDYLAELGGNADVSGGPLSDFLLGLAEGKK